LTNDGNKCASYAECDSGCCIKNFRLLRQGEDPWF
jgi:hypothetical protein